jgi:hypothetical protein
MKNLNMIRANVIARRYRSAWDQGVRLYAIELLDQLQEAIEGGWLYDDDLFSPNVLRRALLNGASSWNEYSEGGCSLICDLDIAQRLCTPSELKKTLNGERNPNSRESWIDVQSRALNQAAMRITSAAFECREALREEV